jgi:hypothetical protein
MSRPAANGAKPGEAGRVVVELAMIAVAVAVIVTGLIYASEAPFDHPYRAESARRNAFTGSVVLSALGSVASWALWLLWRARARFHRGMDGPARLLAAAVVLLPAERREWAAAMTSELAPGPRSRRPLAVRRGVRPGGSSRPATACGARRPAG